jgi:4-amino-4-deoxy-L-arabinose transferase-like glycosyltransferase
VGVRLGAGALLAANPLTIRAAWFGTADAPAVLCIVLAFALLMRRRFAAAAALLAAALLLKQFAIVAVPFFALAMLARAARPQLTRAAVVLALVVAAGFLPFLVADAAALWRDTVTYGGETYRIIGYGLSGWLLQAGIIEERTDAYPFFLLAALVWLPATVLLLRAQWRTPALWVAAAGFSISVFLLFFVGRVFQTSYLIWPLAGGVVAVLLAFSGEPEPEPTESAG